MRKLQPLSSTDAGQSGPTRPREPATCRVTGYPVAVAIGTAALVACLAILPGPLMPSLATYALLVAVLPRLIRHFYPHPAFGACNTITLARAAMTLALLAPLASGEGGGRLVAGIAALALLLDGLDGWLARRSGLVSAFGARFDMEVDSALALIMSLHLLSAGRTGGEILILGFARPVFMFASWVFPWIGRPLPQRFRRKAICVLQLATLLVLQLPVADDPAFDWLARIAAGFLLWSFATDILWLRRHRQ
ncbi:CDP-alcohol phosphatidyltransferase family protein [Paracoccus sp. MBLB3053]|uniref:CDP-alcohol phosphatidyltransferase family protein n=1 Tax=Paracoccus aurantius TaxID=3073814 RepID=A0ABU2HMC5_9RHOB|nr:CDP-alcohol phosphatidyltransferase family protein [Paracoccus sp. MBLB3053]MDS9466186.1 CDP-alcohol phosphatidyltransferase family protein [Paracoccus sp. MBLB3053]